MELSELLKVKRGKKMGKVHTYICKIFYRDGKILRLKTKAENTELARKNAYDCVENDKRVKKVEVFNSDEYK